jgi:hypothetical protein
MLRGGLDLPERIDVLWKAVRCHAASQIDLDTHEHEVAGLEAWARRSTRRTSKWEGWLGYVRYRQQRYAEAAELFERALKTREARRERAFLSYYTALAALEAEEFSRARRYGEDARSYFASARHAVHEGTVVAALRMIDLRLGDGTADPALVDAGADCSTAVEGQLAWVEAGLAFRNGQFELCAFLAERAVTRLQASVAGPQLALASALRAAVVGDRSLERAAVTAAHGVTPQVELQVVGLLARAFGPRPEWQARARSLLPAVAGRNPERPMELVSVGEVRRWLALDPHA